MQSDIEILDAIYHEFFKRIQQNVVDVFLCGGASSKGQKSTRDKLKKELEKTSKIRILYPEELFMDILSLNKKHNLLTLEQLLADNCDRICIVCESVGSFVELGAFTNNDSTFSKVVALVQTKYKNQESFLMQGPIKYIQSQNKGNVVFYNSNIEETAKELKQRLFKHNYSGKSIDTIVGLHYFIMLLMFFYRDVPVESVISNLKTLLDKEHIILDNQKFSMLFRSAMKLLYREKTIEQYELHGHKHYRITYKGINLCEQLISKIQIYSKYKLCDKIRLQVLHNAYY